jgi:hypothetical protein
VADTSGFSLCLDAFRLRPSLGLPPVILGQAGEVDLEGSENRATANRQQTRQLADSVSNIADKPRGPLPAAAVPSCHAAEDRLHSPVGHK